MKHLLTYFCQNYVVTLVLLLTFFLYFLLRRNPRIKHYLNKLPGPTGLPVLGNLVSLNCPHNEILPRFDTWIARYGTTFRFWIGNIIPYVFTCDVNVIEKLVSGHEYINKGKYDYSLLYDWLGTGLLTAPASKWIPRRKMLTSAFHFKILEQFVPIFNEQASILVNCLYGDGRDDGREFDIFPYLSKCTLDIICETAMGKRMNIQSGCDNQEYFEAVKGKCHLLIHKNYRPWLRIPLVYRLSSVSRLDNKYLEILKGQSAQVIAARKAERRTMQYKTSVSHDDRFGKQRKVFLDLLLDVQEETQLLTDADIQEEVDTFMFEVCENLGHDSTGVGLGWAILLLAMYPDNQKLLHNELDAIFADNPTRDVTSMDISKMKFLDCCIKETLRLFPNAPLITRQIERDLCLDDHTIIPKGATAMIGIYNLHHLSQHFVEPNKFRPERWSSEDGQKRHPYAYIPFSAGPRNCIGQKFAVLEEKVVLARLFQKYSFETSVKYENIKMLPNIVLHSEGGIKVSLRRRE